MKTQPIESEEEKQPLFDSQTQWAFERTKLAKERTLAAWLRTGLAIVAAGFAIAKLLPISDPRWLIQLVSAIFIILGAMTFGIGFYSYYELVRKFAAEGFKSPLVWLMGILTTTLMFGAVVVLVLVFFE